MSCPKCGCKEVHPYGHDCGWDFEEDDDRLQRCSACGEIFDLDDHAPEDEEEFNT